ncbi:DNA primase family protein [Bradyrhizobium elkanii]
MTDDRIIDPGKPSETASAFKAARHPTLINHQDEWLSWDGSAYQSIEEATIESEISEFLQGSKRWQAQGNNLIAVPYFAKSKDVKEVFTLLKHACHVPSNTMAPPSWLPGAPKKLAAIDPRNVISFRNGLLDIRTRKLYPATPAFFTRSALPFDFDPDAPKPERWLGFLDEVTAGKGDSGEPVPRPELVQLIREMMGYLISSDTSKQVVFHFYGQPRSGKGTVLRVLRSIVGERNTAAPTVQNLAGEFGPSSLIGKSLAMITDMATDNRQHLSAAASHINAISGEDPQTIRRMYREPWSGYLPTRFVLVSNALPNFGAHTLALSTRLRIVPFENSFQDRMDADLTAKLIAERAGIILWCLDGLDDLNLTGRFDEPADCATLKARLVLRSNPIVGFVAECCTVVRDVTIDKDVLYDRYLDYCDDVRVRPKPKEDFSEGLADLFPSVYASKRTHSPGSARKVPCYRNIVLNDTEMARLFKTDPGLAELGVDPLLRDEAGNLIMRDDREPAFEY